jgi:hypothetical protein
MKQEINKKVYFGSALKSGHLEDRGLKWQDNIKMNLKNIVVAYIKWGKTDLSQYGIQWQASV